MRFLHHLACTAITNRRYFSDTGFPRFFGGGVMMHIINGQLMEIFINQPGLIGFETKSHANIRLEYLVS